MAIPLLIRLVLLKEKFFGTSYSDLPDGQAWELANKNLLGMMGMIEYPPIDMDQVEDRKIKMRDGHPISIRIYHPKSDASTKPAIVYYHGGGFVLYGLDTHDRICRRLADVNQSVVISVDYRLAPAFKFPTAPHDCYDALCWVHAHAESLNIIPSQISVAGDSAGGNLATVTCFQSKEHHGPPIHSQILIYPTVDGTLQFPSIDRNGKGYLLTKESMIWFVGHYARNEKDKKNPMMSPIFQEDLVGLPPAFVLTAEYDPLVDEGAAYAQKLKDAGVEVQYKLYTGMIHGFFNIPKLTKRTFEAHDDIRSFLESLQ